MWMISLVFVTLLLVPAAVFAASTSHDSATNRADRLGSASGPGADPGGRR